MTIHPSRLRQQDLTAHARIRYAALELYALQGEDRVSMRAVAAHAGVTVGLIQHHFGTKHGLGEAVDALVVSYFVDALESVEHEGEAARIIAARDEAVRTMLRDNPLVVKYVNRALVDPGDRGARLIPAIVELTTRELTRLRDRGYLTTSGSDAVLTLRVIMGQVGQLLLEPMVAAIWAEMDGAPDERPTPRITIDAP